MVSFDQSVCFAGIVHPARVFLVLYLTYLSKYPQAALSTGRTSERICPIRPALACPSAMAIITAMAKPTRVCILALPRIKCLFNWVRQ